MNRTSLEFARVGILSAMVTAGVLLPAKLVQKRAALPAAPAQNEKLQVQEVGPQELVATIGIAVNDKNEVVGTAFGDNDEVRAFIVRNGKGELLPLPNGAPLSAASGINDKGEAVGIAGSENSLRGVVWAGGKAGVLTSGKRDTVATTLSRQSVAAGIAMDAQRSENYFASHLAMISSEFAAQLPRIQDNGFSGMLWSKPGDGKAIGEFIPQSGSPSGILVGLTLGKNGPVPAAFKGGKIGTLAIPGGLQMAVPMAANDKEIFVGAGVTEDRSVKPVGWGNGKTGFLPVPGNKQGLALGINNENQVAGVIEVEGGEAHAAVWSNGKVIDLNDAIDKRGGWTLVQARGINNKGYVVGTGIKDGHIGAFLVGPIK